MICWSRVDELRDEIGSDDFVEVTGLFMEEVEEVLERLPAIRDPAQLEADMHFLKGCALNLGFDAFGQICAAGEKAARAGAADAIAIDPVVACYRESKSVFLSGPSAA